MEQKGTKRKRKKNAIFKNRVQTKRILMTKITTIMIIITQIMKKMFVRNVW